MENNSTIKATQEMCCSDLTFNPLDRLLMNDHNDYLFDGP